MTTRHSIVSLVSGLILTTALAAILAFIPADSLRGSSFLVAIAVSVLLIIVLAWSVIQMTMYASAPLPSEARGGSGREERGPR